MLVLLSLEYNEESSKFRTSGLIILIVCRVVVDPILPSQTFVTVDTSVTPIPVKEELMLVILANLGSSDPPVLEYFTISLTLNPVANALPSNLVIVATPADDTKSNGPSTSNSLDNSVSAAKSLSNPTDFTSCIE